MSNNILKVTFIDNASSQYDVNADEIRCWKTKLEEDEIGKKQKLGKLYLGDRYAATFLQLKHRDCYCVINCAKDLHGFSKEEDVIYLNIDPLVPSDETKDNHFEECYQFINDETNGGNNVLITCHSGLNKSAAIVLYFIMKKNSLNLADSIRLIKRYRNDIKPNPELIRLLMKQEMEIFGCNSIYLGGRANREIIYSDKYFIQSDRLGFKIWTLDLLQQAKEIWFDPQVTKLIGGPYTKNEVLSKLLNEIETYKSNKLQYFPMYLKDKVSDVDIFVGCCGLRRYKNNISINEIGVHIKPEFWGNGIAEEATRLIIKYGFDELNLNGIYAGHNPMNVASKHLLNKLGIFIYLYFLH